MTTFLSLAAPEVERMTISSTANDDTLLSVFVIDVSQYNDTQLRPLAELGWLIEADTKLPLMLVV